MTHIFFENWEGTYRVVITKVLAYILLIFLLRASGKRTLSKMDAFDFIITITLGSTLATVILSKDVALVDEGLVSHDSDACIYCRIHFLKFIKWNNYCNS